MKKNICLLALALFTMLFVSSCHRTPESAQLIPDDAVMVFRWDVKGTLEKTGDKNSEKLNKFLKDKLKEADLNTALRKKVEAIIEDPKTLGLDLRDPIYFVAGTKEVKSEMLYVGSVYDKDDFTEFLKLLEKEDVLESVKEKDDICTAYGNRLIIVYDKNKFAMTERKWSQEDDEAVDELKDLFDNDVEKSLADNESFKVMDGKGGLAQVLLRGEGASDNLGRYSKEQLKNIEKQMDDAKLEDFDMVYNLDVKDGEASLTAEVLTNTDEAKNYLDKVWGYLGEIDGSMLDYLDKNAMFTVAANVNGEKLYELVKSFLKEAGENEKALAKKMVTTLNGDMVFAFYDVVEGKFFFDSYISTKNNNLLSMLSENSDYESAGNNKYTKEITSYKYVGYESVENPDSAYTDDDDSFYNDYVSPFRLVTVGKFIAEYKNNATYFGQKEDPVPFKKAKNAVDPDDFKGKKFYARFNPKAILDMKDVKENADRAEMKEAKNIIELFDYAELFVEDNKTVTLRVMMKNKDKSPLEVLGSELIDLLEKYAN